MAVLYLLLLFAAFLLIVLDAFGVVNRRVSLAKLGLALFVLVYLIKQLVSMS